MGDRRAKAIEETMRLANQNIMTTVLYVRLRNR